MKTLLTILVLAVSISSTYAQEKKEHSHNEHLTILLSEYLEVKNALVVDDFEKASKHLMNFTKEVKGNEEMNNHGDHASKHEMHHNKMVEAVTLASQATDLAQLRSSFDEISEELLIAIQNQGFDTEKLFLQFCPMANNGEGANWLSKSEQIANPYYGTKMHTCGATVKAIN